MKTTNQFDYPTAAATTYKAYRQEPSKNESNHDKPNYKDFLKQQSEHERNRVKLEEQRRKQKKSKDDQKRLRQQLEHKRKELEQLQLKREQATKQALLAAEQAKIKDQNDRQKKAENELRAKQSQQNAQFRFRDALRRLQNQRQQSAIQDRQAQQRRTAQQQAEKVQRRQAIKFKQQLQVKEENERLQAEQEEKRRIQLMKNGLGRIGLNKGSIDYSKTIMHNPHFVFKNEEESSNALERGRDEERRQQELSLQKKQQTQQNQKISYQRSQKALEKMNRQVEYNNYLRETEQLQRQYNLKRIQQGKRNQFVGVKPLTLAQMEANKKLRGEEEFQEMFLSPNVEAYQVPASKYKIVQKKYEGSLQHNDCSSIDCKAESHQKPQSIKKYAWQERQQDDQQEQIQHRPILVEPTPIFTKTMAETRLEEPKPHKQELSYSQSEDDSSYA